MPRHSPNSPGSLYDMLLYRISDRFSLDAHNDEPIEGDLHVLDAAASHITRDDAGYQREYQEILEGDADLRAKNYQLFGLILRTLLKHGHLDRAPIAVSESGAEFLSE